MNLDSTVGNNLQPEIAGEDRVRAGGSKRAGESIRRGNASTVDLRNINKKHGRGGEGGKSGANDGDGKGGKKSCGAAAKRTRKMPLSDEAEDFENVNQVPWKIKLNDPGCFFAFGTADEVHAALAFEHLPPGLVRGPSAAESYENIHNWVVEVVVAICGDLNCRVPLPPPRVGSSRVAFHNLPFRHYVEIMQRVNIITWGAYCLTNHLSCGTMYMVSGTGSTNHNDLNMILGPFVTPP